MRVLLDAARMRGATDQETALDWLLSKGYVSRDGETVHVTVEGEQRAERILAATDFAEPDDEFTAALLSDLQRIARRGGWFRGARMERLVRQECARREVAVPAKVQGFLDGYRGRVHASSGTR